MVLNMDQKMSFCNRAGTKHISARKVPSIYGNKVVNNKTRLRWNYVKG